VKTLCNNREKTSTSPVVSRKRLCRSPKLTELVGAFGRKQFTEVNRTYAATIGCASPPFLKARPPRVVHVLKEEGILSPEYHHNTSTIRNGNYMLVSIYSKHKEISSWYLPKHTTDFDHPSHSLMTPFAADESRQPALRR